MAGPSTPKGGLSAEQLAAARQKLAGRAGTPGYGPRPLETGREYLERLNRERLARHGGATPEASPETARSIDLHLLPGVG
jgi:hypothetical protein